MNFATLIPIVLVGAFGGYAMYVSAKRGSAMPAATRVFLETTGYRHAAILDQPMESQVAQSLVAMHPNADGLARTHLVRNVEGAAVHLIQEVRYKARLTRSSSNWSTPLLSPARTLVHVADRSLSSTTKALKEAFSKTTRSWAPVYETEVRSGDAQLDERFVCYGQDPDAVRRLLNQPGMRNMLLACAEVDLVVYPDRVSFADPLQKNISALMGTSRMSDVVGMMKLSIPAHDAIARLIVATARYC